MAVIVSLWCLTRQFQQYFSYIMAAVIVWYCKFSIHMKSVTITANYFEFDSHSARDVLNTTLFDSLLKTCERCWFCSGVLLFIYKMYIYMYLPIYSQTCIKRSPLGQRKKWSFKTVDLLKEVSSYEIFWYRTRKM